MSHHVSFVDLYNGALQLASATYEIMIGDMDPVSHGFDCVRSKARSCAATLPTIEPHQSAVISCPSLPAGR